MPLPRFARVVVLVEHGYDAFGHGTLVSFLHQPAAHPIRHVIGHAPVPGYDRHQAVPHRFKQGYRLGFDTLHRQDHAVLYEDVTFRDDRKRGRMARIAVHRNRLRDVQRFYLAS